jgi:RNase P subunit RPR2
VIDPILRIGKCHVCGTVYRWEDRDGLRLKDAICRDCDAPLKKTKHTAEAHIVEVEADWLRRRMDEDG